METINSAGDGGVKAAAPRRRKTALLKEQLVLHSMLVPGVVLAFIFMILPMIGVVMAFQDYSVVKGFFGSPWVGFKYFNRIFSRPDFLTALWNTVFIALMKIIFMTILSVVFALLMNEIMVRSVKKTVQTILFLPYFLSWVILGNIIINIVPTSIMEDGNWFRTIIVGTDVWKTLGYQVIIYLATITNIDPTLYEAAKIDGANHMQLCRHVTIPGLMSMLVLNAILNIGNIMNAGFEQILVMYNPLVYDKGDILDTMSYRIGLLGRDYSTGAAIGLFKSVISCGVFSFSYWLAYKVKGYKIF